MLARSRDLVSRLSNGPYGACHGFLPGRISMGDTNWTYVVNRLLNWVVSPGVALEWV